MSSSGLNLPAICLQGAVAWIVRDSSQLQTCSKENIKGAYYRDMVLFDSSLSELRVSKVKLIGPYGPFWGFSLLRKRSYRVDIEFRSVRGLSYPEVREAVSNMFLSHTDFWDNYGDPAEFAAECKSLETWGALVDYIERFSKPTKRSG